MQDLSHADIGKLLVRTTFTAAQVMDWYDQARLYLFLDASETESFRRGGLRTACDFVNMWEHLHLVQETSDNDKRRKTVALLLQTIPDRLDAIYQSLVSGNNLDR